jgi:DNA-binding NarL/FixJ family response regulator
MSKKVTDIIIVETSAIIYEGLFGILTNTGHSFSVHPAENLIELERLNLKNRADIILINPVLIQNQEKHFLSLKRELAGVRWIGITYSLTDPRVSSELDDVVNINDSPEKITTTIHRQLLAEQPAGNGMQQQEALTDRETDVLKLLVSGNANKEIADKLNISTHTVISHRKNISQKTGIKSVSGLTIYAVINNIIKLDNYRE